MWFITPEKRNFAPKQLLEFSSSQELEKKFQSVVAILMGILAVTDVGRNWKRGLGTHIPAELKLQNK